MAPLDSKWRRGFWALIATQFQGALNENGLKNLVNFLIISLALSEAKRQELVLIVGAMFVGPFILFSMLGGFLADRFSKRTVTIGTKFFELGVMFFASAALAWSSIPLAMAAMFLASTQAAIFGPSKYGLLPELVPDDLLSWGNGVLELGTFIAIIAGTVMGATMADVFRSREGISGLLFAALSIIGIGCSYAISRVPAADPAKKYHPNLIGEVFHQTVDIHRDRILWLALIGSTYFWFLGALLQQTIIFYGHDILKVSDTRGGILLAGVAIGIGLGSMAAGILSRGTIEYGLIPLGCLGMTVFGLVLSLPGLSFNAVLALLAALGFTAGFFAVPVNALIQHRPPEENKGTVIAVANWWSFVGIGAAFGAYYALSVFLHQKPSGIFLWASLATLISTLYVLYIFPDAWHRMISFLRGDRHLDLETARVSAKQN
jgi:acyl-[acyl-carrier-protein]-phospholipid O-acyltransferase / long-chain-fatty-acid--[acyl-carrier-protein] ligase